MAKVVNKSNTTRILQEDELIVGAYYYTWFPHNFYSYGYLRKYIDPPQIPVLGQYKSDDPAVAEQHIEWASTHGINFFAIDWWSSRPAQQASIINGFMKAKNLDQIKFCMVYESWSPGFDKALGATIFDETKRNLVVNDIVDLAERFFSHPSYLHIDGRPVLIVYLTRTWAGDYERAVRDTRKACKEKGYDVFLIGDEIFWNVTPAIRKGTPHPLTKEPQKKRIDLFDAITAYNLYEGALTNHAGYGADSAYVADCYQLYEAYRETADTGVYFIPNIIPGYNDRGVRHREGHYAIPRQWEENGKEASFMTNVYQRLVRPFIDSRLNMVLITSWNEWNEDTAIEPLVDAPPTTLDVTDVGDYFTQGYAYSGHGLQYLEAVQRIKAEWKSHASATNGACHQMQ